MKTARQEIIDALVIANNFLPRHTESCSYDESLGGNPDSDFCNCNMREVRAILVKAVATAKNLVG